jgi:D-alanyl-D-alanine dipeptidase
MEISDIRRRLRTAIDQARHQAAERRTRVDAAARDYEEFLVQRAVPVVHQFAAALAAEGYLFKVFTPAGSVRLASERSPEEFIELFLDDAADPPEVIGRTSRGRVREHTPVVAVSEDDVLSFLTNEILLLLER